MVKFIEKNTHKVIILRMMLIGSLCFTSVLNIIISLEMIINKNDFSGIDPILTALGHFIISVLLFFCIKGYSKVTSFGFVLALILPSVYCSIRWGSLMHQALLLYILAIVVISVLFDTLSAIYVTGVIFIFLLFLTHAQQGDYLFWESDWIKESYDNIDVLTSFLIFCVITLIHWISNNELSNALKKSLTLETKLRVHNDSLETSIAIRTQELIRLQELRLKELDRFATFGKLTGNLIHDLMTPLTTVSLNLETISTNGINNDTANKAIIRSLTANNKALYYVKNAYNFLGGEKQIQFFNPNEEIISSVLLHEQKLGKITLLKDLCCSCELKGNPVRFSQLVSNLITNAIDAVEANTNISHGKITLHTSISNNKYIIEVIDNGVGMTDKMLPRVWDPFFTTKVIGKGSGLGLCICKEIINDFKGTVEMRSQELIGTTVTVYLPINV